MANTGRRYVDKTGKMFIPMNVEGGSWNEHFITTPKLVCLGLIVAAAVGIGMSLSQAYAPLSSYFLCYAIWAVITFYVLRFVIFEEKYYYKMYKQLHKSEVTTPAIFWDIASIKDTMDGAILTYSDAKIGVIVRVERDTITGKPPEFKETHYDAISDFYKEIMLQKYNFVQMNIMEQAGNDPRLDNLDKLIYNNDNPNIKELMEIQIGYIKNITHHTLYESDYILVYTSDLAKIDTIIGDVIDIIYKLLDGAYIGYRILRARDIIEFVKEEYGVLYFNYTEATLEMFKAHGVNTKNPFDISKVIYADGEVQIISPREVNKINKLASDAMNGTVDMNNISIKEALRPRESQIKKEKLDFESLSDGFTRPVRPKATAGHRGVVPVGKPKFGKGNKRAPQPQQVPQEQIHQDQMYSEHFDIGDNINNFDGYDDGFIGVDGDDEFIDI